VTEQDTETVHVLEDNTYLIGGTCGSTLFHMFWPFAFILTSSLYAFSGSKLAGPLVPP
jgi:hypothetical protein